MQFILNWAINSSITKHPPLKIYIFSQKGTVSIGNTSIPTIDFQYDWWIRCPQNSQVLVLVQLPIFVPSGQLSTPRSPWKIPTFSLVKNHGKNGGFSIAQMLQVGNICVHKVKNGHILGENVGRYSRHGTSGLLCEFTGVYIRLVRSQLEHRSNLDNIRNIRTARFG